MRTVRALLTEYATWLEEHSRAVGIAEDIVQRGAAKLAREIEGLPGEYGPPRGRLLLAERGRVSAGCVALRPHDARSGEIKRLFVRPEFRRQQVGEFLTRSALEHAREIGYERVVLDTMGTMAAAIELYRRLGFRPIPPYWANPLPGALYFEYPLAEGFRSE